MIILKTPSQINNIRRSCKIVAFVLDKLKKQTKPGITTKFLNDLAEDLCFQKGGIPAFKGYRGFPFSICSSRNEEIVHGFPSDKPLEEGDILSIDFGVIYKGWYGDSAFTVGVGKISQEAEDLLKTCEECLFKGIEAARLYNRIGDISYNIQKYAENRSYGVIREFVGHGVGRDLHEAPQVPNFGSQSSGYMLKAGTVIAIEPMITIGSHKPITLSDGWTTVTEDRKWSAHFEHTIAITENGTEILTKLD
jgi:methionyl aminopeptidase